MARILFLWTLLIATAAAAAAQDGGITGRVTDGATGRPLAGANVTVEGTAIGSISGKDGRYLVSRISPGQQRVRFSFIGYIARRLDVTVSAGDTATLDVALTPSLIPGSPVTVTATRGKERETPATFTTLERQQIRDRYTTQDIPVLLSELPSSTYYSESGNNIGYTYLNIRGFDARRIAVMVNGIPQNDPEDHNVYWLDFPDLAASLEDVQVQRGGGSAFYGPPAIGGSVNLVTSQFAAERSLEVSAGAGSFNTRRLSAAFSSGLLDSRYAFHARLARIRSDGYRERSWTDFASYFFGAIRYDESMTTQLNFYGGPVADHLAYVGIPKEDVTNRERRRMNPILRNEELENFSQPHYELFHEWRLSSDVTLNNTMFYVTGEGFFDYDGSWAPLSYYRIAPQFGFPVSGDPDTLYLPGALIRAYVANRQYGWMPRVTIRHDDGEIIAGAEVRIHRSDHWGRIQWAQELPPEVPNDYRYYEYNGAKDIVSLYVHEQYRLRPDLSLMVNLQYAYNRYRLYNEKFLGTDFSVPYHFLNPRAGINFNIDDRWNAYLSIAYTSREPRLKNLYDAAEASTPASWGAVVPQFNRTPAGTYDFKDPLVRPESLFDLELGSAYADTHIKSAANVYWMEFTDEIVKNGQVDRFGQPITGNAARTRHVGIEVSATVTPFEGLTFSGNATISRNRFVRHTDYSGSQPRELDGNPIAGFPDGIANVRLTYTAGPLTASWSTRFVGRQHTDNFRDERNTVDPYTVSDASLICRFNGLFGDLGLEARLQVNNVFDALYAAYGEGERFFVAAERNAFFNLRLIL
ncbi:MAG: TonB-dependent receptor [Bacteroidota bacterium]